MLLFLQQRAELTFLSTSQDLATSFFLFLQTLVKICVAEGLFYSKMAAISKYVKSTMLFKQFLLDCCAVQVGT